MRTLQALCIFNASPKREKISDKPLSVSSLYGGGDYGKKPTLGRSDLPISAAMFRKSSTLTTDMRLYRCLNCLLPLKTKIEQRSEAAIR